MHAIHEAQEIPVSAIFEIFFKIITKSDGSPKSYLILERAKNMNPIKYPPLKIKINLTKIIKNKRNFLCWGSG